MQRNVCMTFEWPYANRRTVIGSLGTGAVLALAGCLDDSDDEEPETDDTDETTDDEETDDTDETDENGDENGGEVDDDEAEQLSEPTEFPDGEECAVCNMITAEYPDWNAQLVHGSGTRTYFCSSGCLAAYYPDPLEFGDCEAPIENAWVTDYETGDLIDGQEAYYVLVEDADHIDDIMMMNPTPFASREDAEALVEELNAEFDADYDVDEDIVRSDAFDMELAMQYRGRLFEDDDGDDGH